MIDRRLRVHRVLPEPAFRPYRLNLLPPEADSRRRRNLKFPDSR